DRPHDDLVEVQLALLIPGSQQREVARRQAVAVPGDAEVAAEVEEALELERQRWAGAGDADEDAGPGRVAAEDRLLQRLRPSDRLEGVVDAIAAGQFLDLGDRVALAR